jgi:putative ABC transport system permease protein
VRVALGLVFCEVWHRKVNFLLSVVAVTAAVLIGVALAMINDASQRETRRITRDLGFNVRIIPQQTDMDRFWMDGFADQTMPESTVERLVKRTDISYNHLLATLQQRIPASGQDVVLTGLSDELFPPGRKKPLMVHPIPLGEAHVGYQVARRLGLRVGDSLKLGGVELQVARCAPETGSVDDIRVFTRLEDAQRILDLPGRINEIQAIDCLCQADDQNPLATLRAQLRRALPETKLVLDRVKADKRARQRQMIERLAPYTIALVLAVAAAWVTALAVMNVRERYSEIGILRAIGYGTGTIATLVLGRAILIGLVAALIGFALGSWFGLAVGPQLFPLTAAAIRVNWQLLGWALLAAPTLAAVASFIPAMVAVSHDPAVTLRES